MSTFNKLLSFASFVGGLLALASVLDRAKTAHDTKHAQQSTPWINEDTSVSTKVF